MDEEQRVGEVIEACTTDFTAQCYELYQSPPLGSLVKTRFEVHSADSQDAWLYAVVYKAETTSGDSGRRPIARGKNERDEDEIYRASPQLAKLLKSDFSGLVVGHKSAGQIYQHLPPRPARIHGFVNLCSDEEVRAFSRSFDFLNVLLKARLEISIEELTGATLRRMGQVYGLERHAFLVTAGKELAALLSSDYAQLKAILKGLKNDAK
jgi:hypothetical protein